MEKAPLQLTPAGALRFNTDTRRMEYYNGNEWVNITSTSPEVQTGGTRGVIAGGFSNNDVIEYANIDTTGNFIDFGDMTQARHQLSCMYSRTRGCHAAGGAPGASNVIDYITISSTGNATDFGDVTVARADTTGCANATRGLTGPGLSPADPDNVIDYITIASTGNAVDFGDTTTLQAYAAGTANRTRAFFGGGQQPSSPYAATSTVICYAEIATTGNAADFGDLAIAGAGKGAVASATRAVWGAGFLYNPSVTNSYTIEYVETSSLGNAIDFGDLPADVGVRGVATMSSCIRGVFAGGYNWPNGNRNTASYIIIPTTGNAVDFGDCTVSLRQRGTGGSNGHGGLG